MPTALIESSRGKRSAWVRCDSAVLLGEDMPARVMFGSYEPEIQTNISKGAFDKIDSVPLSFDVAASWFETRGVATLLTMRFERHRSGA
jgi:hypothetical protein